MSQVKFKQLYQQLNPSQKEAVEAIEGPVLVIAGPGTGKTQILTLRIANILRQTDTSPNSILALTFTRSAVHSIRKRLVEIVGSAGYRVNIQTFHGFCNQVIKDYAEEFPRIIGATSATIIDQVKVLQEIIAETKLKILKPYGSPYYHLLSILSEIERLKRENVSSADLLRLLKITENNFKKNTTDLYYEKGARAGQMRGKYRAIVKNLAKNRELQKIYQRYGSALRAKRFYDFGDMVMEVLKVLRSNQDLLLSLQEEYQYFLADEHQDANQAQNELLKLLASYHPSPNIFIVGDEKQAIFQFQGASRDNFNYFKKLYPEAKIIVLKNNYRSTQTILDAAQSLIQQEEGLPAESKMKLFSTVPSQGELIRVLAFGQSELEINFLVGEVKKTLKKFPAETVAVIYHDNADALPLVEALERAKLPYLLHAEDNLFNDRDISKLLTLLRAINNFGDEVTLAKALPLDFLNLSAVPVYQLLHQAREEKKTVFEKLSEIRENNLAKFFQSYVRWHTLAHNENLAAFFEAVVNESGFVLDLLRKKEVAEKLHKLRALFDLVKSLTVSHKEAKLSALIEYLDLALLHGLKLPAPPPLHNSGVELLTAHKAKGLEFDRVYIINARDGHWGHRRRRTFSLTLRGAEVNKDEASERRLFYVALTRAKKAVTITYSTQGEAGQNYLPTQFIDELGGKVEKGLAGETKTKPDYLRPRHYTGPKLDDKEYLKNLFVNQGLAVTALNNYLDCPWKYFFQNLLRLPAAKSKHLIYGTAVHAALKVFFDQFKDTGRLNKKLLLTTFSEALAREPLTPADYKQTLNKGEKTLLDYLAFYQKTWVKPLHNEFRVRGIKLGSDLKINGVIDKLEERKNGQINVVDYKTGKPRSRHDKNYWRQLVFYKLLLDNYAGGQYKVATGTIDFVEPNERGIYKKEEFILTTDNTKDLTETIKKVADEILTLKFWHAHCSNPVCTFCHLREAMKS